MNIIQKSSDANFCLFIEAISKLGFSVEISRQDRRDKNAMPRINPPRLLTGSSTRILWYVEDLRRGVNADIGRKDFFEIAYSIGNRR
jgi:hypothetical protein